ncbi:MAG: quinol:cytochrome C oxidoreductase [Leadbetterella sp.]
MGHHHEIPSLDEQFEFSASLKKNLILSTIIGVVLVVVGAIIANLHLIPDAFADHGAHAGGHDAGHGDAHGPNIYTRVVANLWMNSVYFIGISVAGAFFLSYNYVAKAGWYTSFKRVPEAFPSFIIIPAVIMLILFAIPSTRHMIFHWTHEGIMDKTSHHFDKIIAGKKWFLNIPFFLIRMIAYFVVWYYLWTQIRKNSILEDQYGGLEYYYKQRSNAKLFLMFFAVTSSTAAWDLSMSIDPHWFSTMFGWYHLASWHVSGLAAIMLTILLLKDQGYLKAVNFSSIHDLGKLMFGFSVFWTYVWFSQYLLIFYANLPEETIYFKERLEGYGGRYFFPFMFNLLLNFFLPFLILMARESKRNMTLIKVACGSILMGHWFDFYQMHMPGIAKGIGNIGLIEWGTTLAFASMFIYFVANQLTKANLYTKNHPFIEESTHHDI